jgi:hypothetical protein
MCLEVGAFPMRGIKIPNILLASIYCSYVLVNSILTLESNVGFQWKYKEGYKVLNQMEGLVFLVLHLAQRPKVAIRQCCLPRLFVRPYPSAIRRPSN